MRKIKIMHIVRPAAGGMKNHVLSLLRNLSKNRYDLILVCPKQVATKSSDFEILNLEIPGGINPLIYWKSYKELMEILYKKNVDIVHTHGFKAGIIGRLAAYKAEVPIIINTVHNFIYDNTSWYFKYPVAFLQGKLSQITDAQITVSDALKMEVSKIEGCSMSKIHTIYNGINLNDYKVMVECNSFKKSLGIPLDAPIVGVISRLIPQKGVHLFIKAARLISEKIPEVRFLIVGDGPFKVNLKNEAAKLGLTNRVRFLGHIPEISRILPLINIIVIPSLSEGLSISAIEAMAFRRPVVAFAVGGIPEVVSNHRTGFLVPKGDYQELANKVVCLLKTRRLAESFGKKGLEIVEEKFLLSSMVKKTENLYDELLRKKNYPATRVSVKVKKSEVIS